MESYTNYAEELQKLLGSTSYRLVGQRIERIDGLDKVTGRAKYTADLLTDGVLKIRPVVSKVAHALIKRVSVENAVKVEGVNRVITAQDIPGENVCGYYLDDQPLLARGKVRYIGEIIALVVAETESAAWEAADLIEVDYEELPSVFDPQEAISGEFKIHETKSPAEVRIRKGDVERGFKESDVVIERFYKADSQDHAYLETEAAIAIPEDRGGITVISTNQNPFRTRSVVARILGVPYSKVRVCTPYIGGGFGGKDTYGPIISSLAAVAAMTTGKPAAIVYTRQDSFALRFKRTPFYIRYKSGATKEGKLKAVEVEFICDCGAYASQVIGLMRRAAYHATGVYEIPNCKIDGMAVYTNNIPVAAFNGFGNPQMTIAIESQMDILAEELGMDPIEFRLKNVLVPGSRTGTNQLLDHSVGIKPLLEKLAENSEWKTKREKINQAKTGEKRRGIGVACSWHGCGTTGFKHDWAGASIILNPDGSITYNTGIVEIGQGTVTSHAIMIAETLGVPLSWVRVEGNDTSKVPDSGETHAQRGTILGGTAAVDAAIKLRKRINVLASELLGCKPEDVCIENGTIFDRIGREKKVSLKDVAREMYQRGLNPAEFSFILARRGYPDPETGQGEPYAAYSFGCVIAEVEVDTGTGQIKVLKLYPGVAAGRLIQPDVVRGQANGCSLIGLGYALTEMVVKSRGRMINDSYTDYLIPTIKDKPDIHTLTVVEDEYKYSGYGAKGVGELLCIAVPAAILNAVYNATGVRFYQVPLSPEQVYFGLKGGSKNAV
ncbi:MAG: xanthine dehydrogenase family protein molybdopterin-binding subunit [Candidatus Methanomethyliaceae archaeon]